MPHWDADTARGSGPETFRPCSLGFPADLSEEGVMLLLHQQESLLGRLKQ